MNRGAPQGIEIAPARDFGEFRGVNPSPAPTFPKKIVISKISGSCTRCLCRHNFLDSQRPDVIGTAFESQHTGGHDVLDSFSNNIIFGHENEGQSSKTYGLYDRLSSSNSPCRRYYSTVQPLHESHVMTRGRAAGH